MVTRRGEAPSVATNGGRAEARKLVRAHRLWESYMAEHFELPEDHLHETAERVEHVGFSAHDDFVVQWA